MDSLKDLKKMRVFGQLWKLLKENLRLALLPICTLVCLKKSNADLLRFISKL